MADINLIAAWVGILAGMLAGALQGLRFHRADWLGGYGSWPRRLTRLGHVSFFGLGFVNLAFFLTLEHTGNAEEQSELLVQVARASSWLLVAGAVLMPTVCYISAFRQSFRHLFFLPVTSLVLGVLGTIVWIRSLYP